MMRVLIVLALLLSTGVYGKMDRSIVKKNIRNMPSSVVKKTAKNIDASRVSDISKRVKVRKMSDVQKLDVGIDVISKKGKDAELLLEKGPITTITLYSKHGDEFIEIYQKTQRSIMGINAGAYAELVKVVPVEKLSTKIIKNFKNISESGIATRFIKVMKNTGKKGYDISKKITKYAKENPKSSAVATMYVWFLADPTGFEEALQKSGDDISVFAADIVKTATSVAINVPLKVADAAGDSIVQGVKNSMTPAALFTLILVLFAWIGWKFRDTIYNLPYKRWKEKLIKLFKKESKNDGPL